MTRREDTPDGSGRRPSRRAVTVLGLGRIGLPLALLFARDHDVTGVDVDTALIRGLKDGELPFEEPGLEELYDEVSPRFDVRSTLERGAEGRSTAYVIVTPTPLDPTTGVADLGYVRAAAESVASVVSAGDLVVLESTVPPGTSAKLVRPVLEGGGVPGSEIGYVHSPERALPGATIEEMVANHRILGASDPDSAAAASELYGFVEGEIHLTTPRTAEFVKLIENTYRDVNIAVANEFAKLAELNEIDGHEAIELANHHPRVDILSPGPGVGGHCLPIDPQFLVQSNFDSRLISAAREVNRSMPKHALRLVHSLLGNGHDARLAVLGVAYKGGVSDTRETPALPFYHLARNAGHHVTLTDPHVESFDHELVPLESAVRGSDCVVLLADHPEYGDLDPAALRELVASPNLVDTRGVLDRGRWEAAGFSVRTLGDGRWMETVSPPVDGFGVRAWSS